MLKYLILLIIKIVIIESFCYSTNIKIISKRDMCDTIGNFMNLNEILNKNNKENNLKIVNYNNKSLSIKYNTYSYLEEYEYKNEIIIKNKNNYYGIYKFKIDELEFKYLFKIRSKDISNNNKRTLWDIDIKYNNNYVSSLEDVNNTIYKIIFGCVNKRPNKRNEILENYFR